MVRWAAKKNVVLLSILLGELSVDSLFFSFFLFEIYKRKNIQSCSGNVFAVNGN